MSRHLKGAVCLFMFAARLRADAVDKFVDEIITETTTFTSNNFFFRKMRLSWIVSAFRKGVKKNVNKLVTKQKKDFLQQNKDIQKLLKAKAQVGDDIAKTRNDFPQACHPPPRVELIQKLTAKVDAQFVEQQRLQNEYEAEHNRKLRDLYGVLDQLDAFNNAFKTKIYLGRFGEKFGFNTGTSWWTRRTLKMGEIFKTQKQKETLRE